MCSHSKLGIGIWGFCIMVVIGATIWAVATLTPVQEGPGALTALANIPNYIVLGFCFLAAVGALGNTGGSIKDSLDLSQMRDGLNVQIFTDSSDDHGAQVSRRIQDVWPYYEQLGIKLEVIPLPE